MPQVFKIGGFIVYFWINEGLPLEPVHVHIAEGVPTVNGTKVWITKTGRAIAANNESRIPERKLRIIMAIIEARHEELKASGFLNLEQFHFSVKRLYRV